MGQIYSDRVGQYYTGDDKLSMEQRFEYQGRGPFDLPAASFTSEASEKALSEEAGLAWHSAAPD